MPNSIHSPVRTLRVGLIQALGGMDSTEAILIGLEQELLRPSVRADGRRLNALITDDFLEVGATGRSFVKAEVLVRLPQESGVVFAASEMRACLLAPDVALVTYLASRTHEGQTAHSVRSSVWVQHAGNWQMRYHQGTAQQPAAA